MSDFRDQTNYTVTLHTIPRRIISLVPSQTELLSDLGLDQEVVGITKFCVHPNEWFRNKQRIGGTKDIKLDLIKDLQPDLIIANKEENLKEQIEELRTFFPVWTSDIQNLNDALEMIRQIGIITERSDRAEKIADDIRIGFEKMLPEQHPIRTAYLIWRNPFMAAGGDTFINHIMNRSALKNVFDHLLRYPEITIEELRNSNCELLLLSSEPYPFKEKHIDELQSQLPATKIILVDGEMFSWYGSRLLKTPAYLQQLNKQIRNKLIN